jgi:hypothetical protein
LSSLFAEATLRGVWPDIGVELFEQVLHKTYAVVLSCKTQRRDPIGCCLDDVGSKLLDNDTAIIKLLLLVVTSKGTTQSSELLDQTQCNVYVLSLDCNEQRRCTLM